MTSTFIHSLPPEILGEIFTYIPTPLTFSSVCRYWRDTAHSTPAFWTKIPTITTRISVSLEEDLGCLRAWLARSAEQLLEVHFDAREVGDVVYARAALWSIWGVVRRWRSVRYVYGSGPPGWIGDLPDGALKADKLQVISVESGATTIPVDDLGLWFISLSTTSPCLKIVSLPGIHKSMPWGQLHQLRLTYQADLLHSDCYEILAKSPRLESVEFSVCMMNTMSHSNVLPMLTLGNLRHFTMHTFFDLGPLLNSLTLPSLDTLTITQVYSGWTQSFFPYTPLTSLLTRSLCTLRSLTLRKIEIREDGFLQVLNHPSVKRSLRELTLEECVHPIGDMVLRFLTVVEGVHWALSGLEVLRLRTRVVTTDGVLADMVCSRLGGLRRLAVRLRDAVQHRCDIQRLRAAKGLEVDIELENSVELGM